MATIMETFWSFFETSSQEHDETATEVLWKVDNFSFCHFHQGLHIASPVFKLSKDADCFFKLYPKGQTKGNAMDVYLLKHSLQQRTPKVLFFSIASARDVVWETSGTREDDGSIAASLTVKTDACQSDDVLTIGDTLTIRCVMKHLNEGSFKPKNILLRSSFSVKSVCSTLKVDYFKMILDDRMKHIPNLIIPNYAFKSYLGFSTKCDAIEVCISAHQITDYCYVTCRVIVIDSEGVSLNLLKNGHLFIPNNEEDWISVHPFNAAFFSNNKELYLPDDTLTCMVELTYTDEVKAKEVRYGHKSIRSNVKDSQWTPGSLKSDLRLLLEDNSCRDVHLKIGSESVSVHKSILRARSSVFKAMLDHDTVENATNTVTIPDMDLETLQHMVKFMYTDTVNDLNSSSAVHLYYAADKYDLTLLKRKCAEYLVENLDQSNIYEALVLADMHDDGFLKKRARNFIFTQKSTLVNSENWKNIEKNYPTLAMDMLRELYCKAVVYTKEEEPTPKKTSFY